MTQYQLGSYSLGFAAVDIYVWRERDGAEYYLNPDPDNGACGRMKIGLNQGWPGVLECLLHEAFEACFHTQGLAFTTMNRPVPDSANRVFLFNHQDFTQICGKVGLLCNDVLLALRGAWEENQKWLLTHKDEH